MFFWKRNKKTAKQVAAEKPVIVAPKRGTVPSLVSSDMSILGNLVSEGLIDIDGNIEGNVKCHTATVRKNGFVKGELMAEEVFVYGRVHGMIKSRNVQFMEGCHVEGVIMHESLIIEDGAFVDGRFKRMDKTTLDSLSAPSGLLTSVSQGTETEEKNSAARAVTTQFFGATEEFNEDEGDDSASDKKERVLENLRLIGEAM